MDEHSDGEIEYRPTHVIDDSTDSHLSISDDDELLEIKPPQAKVQKRGHRHRHSSSNGRQVYVRPAVSEHRHRRDARRVYREREATVGGRHHARHEEKAKEEHRHKQAEPIKAESKRHEIDLREKIEKRKQRKELEKRRDMRREQKEVERLRKQQHRYRKERQDWKRRREEVRRPTEEETLDELVVVDSTTPPTTEAIQPSKDREVVVDVEMSPPVILSAHASEEEEEEDEEAEASESSSSSESETSSETESESNSSASSASSQQKKPVVDSEPDVKQETPPPVVGTNSDVDTEIELEKDTLPSYFPAIQGCRSVEEFQCLNRIEEGTYGVVYRAREKKTEKIVALKRLKMEKEKEGFPITSLREINTLLKAQHPNIVTVKEIVVGSNMDKIFIVMDYVEHDMKSLMETMKQKKTSFVAGEVKCLMKQLLNAVGHLHDNWILHRDLKTSNLLFSHKGVLKVGDFGLAREYGSPLKNYTPVVVTLWYRAPELLLGTKEYTTSIDMWSVGCIFAEFLRMEPLFPGKTETDQLNRIFKAVGTPNEKQWPEYPKLPVTQRVTFVEYPPHSMRSKFVPSVLTEVGYELLSKLLTYNPKDRIAAEVAYRHEYFSESPAPVEPAMFPTWPAKSEPGYRKAIASSPKPPSGGQGYKELNEDDGFYIGPGERFNTLQSTFSLKF